MLQGSSDEMREPFARAVHRCCLASFKRMEPWRSFPAFSRSFISTGEAGDSVYGRTYSMQDGESREGSIFVVFLPVVVQAHALVVNNGFEMNGAAPERVDVFERLARIVAVEFRALVSVAQV
jgi:hypothetical protein